MAELRIELEGEYDLSRKAELASVFASIDGGDGPLVIDMSKVSYVDSTMLNQLSRLRFRHRDRQITLAGVSLNVRRILDIANFDRLFQIS
jgi:anti-anti-sigma factor